VKKLILLAALVATSARAESVFRATIRGVVTDGEYPLPGVTVTITSADLEISRKVVTDWYGRFTASELPIAEDYVLTTDFIGFRPATKRHIQLASGDDHAIKLRLREIEYPAPPKGAFMLTNAMAFRRPL